jgi:hypothetical protein
MHAHTRAVQMQSQMCFEELSEGKSTTRAQKDIRGVYPIPPLPNSQRRGEDRSSQAVTRSQSRCILSSMWLHWAMRVALCCFGLQSSYLDRMDNAYFNMLGGGRQ